MKVKRLSKGSTKVFTITTPRSYFDGMYRDRSEQVWTGCRLDNPDVLNRTYKTEKELEGILLFGIQHRYVHTS